MSNLEDNDLPMGRGALELHPKRQHLTQLVNQHAPEYAIAPKSEGFHKAELGRFIRSKKTIITDVIEELMQDGGRFMIKKNGVWVMRVGFNSSTAQVRGLMQDRFNRLIRSWEGNLRPFPPLDDLPPDQNDDEQLHDEVEQKNDCEVKGHDVPIRAHQPIPPLGQSQSDHKDDERRNDVAERMSGDAATGHSILIGDYQPPLYQPQPDQNDDGQRNDGVEQIEDCDIEGYGVPIGAQQSPGDETVSPSPNDQMDVAEKYQTYDKGVTCTRERVMIYKSYKDVDAGTDVAVIILGGPSFKEPCSIADSIDQVIERGGNRHSDKHGSSWIKSEERDIRQKISLLLTSGRRRQKKASKTDEENAISETSSNVSGGPPSLVPSSLNEVSSWGSEMSDSAARIISENLETDETEEPQAPPQGQAASLVSVSDRELSINNGTLPLPSPCFPADRSEGQEASGEVLTESDQVDSIHGIQTNKREGVVQSCSFSTRDRRSDVDELFDSSSISLSETPSFMEFFPASDLEADPVVNAEHGLNVSPPDTVQHDFRDIFQRRRKRAKLGVAGVVGLAAIAVTAILLAVNLRENSEQKVTAPTSGPVSSTPQRSCLKNETSNILVFDDFESTAGNWTTNETTLFEFDAANHAYVLGPFHNASTYPQTEVVIPNDSQNVFLSFDYYVVSPKKWFKSPHYLEIELSWGDGTMTPIPFGALAVDEPEGLHYGWPTSGLSWTLETTHVSWWIERHRIHVSMDSAYLPLGERRLQVTLLWTLPIDAELGIGAFLITDCHPAADSLP